jgi:RHS repeat-associated protein
VSSTYHYLTDALGSVSALVSETGTVAATYEYDPWGRVTGTGGADSWLATRQPLRYRGYYLDAESGLYYLPARYYDPSTYRFLTECCRPAEPEPVCVLPGRPGGAQRPEWSRSSRQGRQQSWLERMESAPRVPPLALESLSRRG